METPRWNDGLDEDEVTDSQKDESFMWGGKDGVIFLLDATMPMFEEDQDGKCWFLQCLDCCRTTMLNKIIGSEHDLIGVVLFGTAKTSNILNVPYVSTLQELKEPSVEKIKQLEQMLESCDLRDFRKEYGHNTDFSLADALWVCQTMFAKINVRLSAQRVLLFTNTSHPHEGNRHAQNQAMKKAEDLGKSGIDLELLNIAEKFDVYLFYKDLLSIARGEEDSEETFPQPARRFEELLTRVCRRNYKKRSVGKVYFTIVKDLKISVGIYNLVRRAPKPKKVLCNRQTNEAVKSSTVCYRGDTAETVLKSELKLYQSFGGRKIMFTPEEVKSMSQISDVGLKLLGFKPANELTIQHHCKPSSFIYPTEDMIKGSTRLFSELLKRCLAKAVVALCVFTPRQHSAPRYVALLPQKMQHGTVEVLPPGFHLIFLPFADHIRKLPLERAPTAAPEKVELAKEIIKKLSFKYFPHQFDNPKLQTEWRNIETVALGHDEPREITDYTVPNQERMEEKIGDLAYQFVKACRLNEVPVKKTKKRAVNSTVEAAKKSKY